MESERERITRKGYGWLGREADKIQAGEHVHWDDEWWLVSSNERRGDGAEFTLTINRGDETLTLIKTYYNTLPTTADPTTAVAKSLVDLWDEGAEHDYPENEAYLEILRERENSK